MARGRRAQLDEQLRMCRREEHLGEHLSEVTRATVDWSYQRPVDELEENDTDTLNKAQQRELAARCYPAFPSQGGTFHQIPDLSTFMVEVRPVVSPNAICTELGVVDYVASCS